MRSQIILCYERLQHTTSPLEVIFRCHPLTSSAHLPSLSFIFVFIFVPFVSGDPAAEKFRYNALTGVSYLIGTSGFGGACPAEFFIHHWPLIGNTRLLLHGGLVVVAVVVSRFLAI